MSASNPDLVAVRRLLAGDRTAFDAFFREYLGRLYRFVLPRAGRDQETAQEIVQQTLCRAIERLGSFRGEASLFTWLCQIARHELSDHWERAGKQARRNVSIHEDPELNAILETLAAPEDTEGDSQNREIGRLVRLVLDYLPTHYGNALEWKYMEGMSVVEIADRLGTSQLAAQSVLQRARSAFREAFAEVSTIPLNDLLPGVD